MRILFQEFIKGIAVAVMSGVIFYSASIFAAPANPSQWAIPDISQLVANLAKSIPNLMQFVTALAYVMGMYFIVEGVMKLKKYGESKTGGGGDANLKGPLMYLGVGGGLLYLPSSVQVGLTTFWETPNPYAYVKETTDPWLQLIQSIFLIVQLIGTIAFIRGLIILSHVGGQGGQPGSLGKAVAHIVGGILCINIYQFIQVITNTFALGQI